MDLEYLMMEINNSNNKILDKKIRELYETVGLDANLTFSQVFRQMRERNIRVEINDSIDHCKFSLTKNGNDLAFFKVLYLSSLDNMRMNFYISDIVKL